MVVRDEVRKMKTVAPLVAAMSNEARCKALSVIAEKLVEKQAEIFAENKKDLEYAEQNGVAAPIVKRLKFDEGKLRDVVAGINQLISLEDPIGKVTLDRELDEGLRLTRITCPIGVIGVIFEARPDALVQISSLCIRSGNCPVLKGGKETTFTNRVLFGIIYEQVVFVLAPGYDLAFIYEGSVKVFSLLCDGESSFAAEAVRELFLPFKILSCLMDLMTVEIGYGICDYMCVYMILVLMHADDVLESGEIFLGKYPGKIERLCLRYIFIFVKADDVVGIHAARILVP